MPKRLATLVALLAFAVCLIAGAFQAGNPFTTVVTRALAAMAGTYGVGWVIGVMGRRVIDENLAAAAAVPAATVPPAAAPAEPVKPPRARGR